MPRPVPAATVVGLALSALLAWCWLVASGCAAVVGGVAAVAILVSEDGTEGWGGVLLFLSGYGIVLALGAGTFAFVALRASTRARRARGEAAVGVLALDAVGAMWSLATAASVGAGGLRWALIVHGAIAGLAACLLGLGALQPHPARETTARSGRGGEELEVPGTGAVGGEEERRRS